MEHLKNWNTITAICVAIAFVKGILWPLTLGFAAIFVAIWIYLSATKSDSRTVIIDQAKILHSYLISLISKDKDPNLKGWEKLIIFYACIGYLLGSAGLTLLGGIGFLIMLGIIMIIYLIVLIFLDTNIFSVWAKENQEWAERLNSPMKKV